MAREYFNAYHSILEAMEPLNDAERGRLFTALLEYSKLGATEKLSGNERFVFPGLRSQIDRDRENYEAKCKKMSENGRSGGRPQKANGFYENHLLLEKAEKAKEKEKEKEKEKTKTKDMEKESVEKAAKPPRTRFIAPDVDSVRAYCQEKGFSVDPERFVDYYTANGWHAGKFPMQDWKAAVRNWERMQKQMPGRRGTPSTSADRELDEDELAAIHRMMKEEP